MNDQDLLLLSFLGIITILYLIEVYSCLNPKVLSPGRGLSELVFDF